MNRFQPLTRIAMGALAGGLLLQPLAAQSSLPMLATRATESLTKMLNLSPEISQKIATINQDAMSKLSAARGRDPKETMNVLKSRDKALKQALTPDQWKTVQSNRANRASEMQTAIMTNELNLNESQVEQVSQLNADSIRQIQDASSLTGDAKAAKLRSVGSSKTETLSKILSPEQFMRWQTFSTGSGKELLGKGLGKFTGVAGL